MTRNQCRNGVTSQRHQRAVTRIEETLGISLDDVFTPWEATGPARHLGIQTLQHLESCAHLLKGRPQDQVKTILDEAVNGVGLGRVKEPRKPERRYFVALYEKLVKERNRSELKQRRKSVVKEALSFDSEAASASESSEEDDEDKGSLKDNDVSQVSRDTSGLNDEDLYPEEDKHRHDFNNHVYNDVSYLDQNDASDASDSDNETSGDDDPYHESGNASQPDSQDSPPLTDNPQQKDYVFNPDSRLHTDVILDSTNSRGKQTKPETLPADVTPERVTPSRLLRKRTNNNNSSHRPKANKRTRHDAQGSHSDKLINSTLSRSPNHDPSDGQGQRRGRDKTNDLGSCDAIDSCRHDLASDPQDQRPRDQKSLYTALQSSFAPPSHIEGSLSPHDSNLPPPRTEPPSQEQSSPVNQDLNPLYNILKADHEQEVRAYDKARTTHATKRQLSIDTYKALEKALDTQFLTPAPTSVLTLTVDALEKEECEANERYKEYQCCQEKHTKAREEELEAFAECITLRSKMVVRERAMKDFRRRSMKDR